MKKIQIDKNQFGDMTDSSGTECMWLIFTFKIIHEVLCTSEDSIIHAFIFFFFSENELCTPFAIINRILFGLKS